MSDREYTITCPVMDITYHDAPDIFTYRRDRPAYWLQRICFWTLKKLGCTWQKKCEEIRWCSFTSTDLRKVIRKQTHEIMRHSSHRPKYILLGHEALRELHFECLQNQMDFDISNLDHPTFEGMHLILVPWFDGILCLEELKHDN